MCGGISVRYGAITVFDVYQEREVHRKELRRILPGGGYDAYSRVIGRHLHKHIPGNPTVVVNNMAGSLLAHSFSLRLEPHIEHQQEGDLSSIYQYDPPCVQVAPNA
jgi:hypothetical protein